MRTCLFSKMLWGCFGYNIQISVNITRWLIGFGWTPECAHFNVGPVAIMFFQDTGLQ